MQTAVVTTGVADWSENICRRTVTQRGGEQSGVFCRGLARSVCRGLNTGVRSAGKRPPELVGKGSPENKLLGGNDKKKKTPCPGFENGCSCASFCLNTINKKKMLRFFLVCLGGRRGEGRRLWAAEGSGLGERMDKEKQRNGTTPAILKLKCRRGVGCGHTDTPHAAGASGG